MKRASLLAALLLVSLLPIPAGAQAPMAWVEPLDADGIMPLPTARHLRIPFQVSIPQAMDGVLDLPASATVDLNEALAAAGWPTREGRLAGFHLDMDSFLIREVDGAGSVTNHNVPFDLFPAGTQLQPFDPASNPVVTLRWILTGASPGGAERHYHVYFDGIHHPAKTPPQLTPEAAATLAASVGPGRGTHHYVSLPNLNGIQGNAEPRAVRVTSLAGPATVQVYEYTDVHRRPSPTTTLQLVGTGAQALYRLGNGGIQASNGLVMLESTGPVMTEMIFNAPSNTFLPALDGGMTGRSFLLPMASNDGSQVTVNCLAPPGQTTCLLRLNGGAETPIASHDATALNVQGLTRVEATRGLVTVQRGGPASSISSALTAWPAIDGPDRASMLLGQAGSGDKLLMMSSEPSTVRVQSLVGGKPVLTPSGGLNLPEGLFGTWDTGWNRVWRPGDQGATHAGGPASILRTAGGGQLTVVSGPSGNPTALVPLQPPLQSLGTGFTYRFQLPADANGIPFGQLVLFATEEGTTITGVRKAQSGITTHEWPSRAQYEAVRIEDPGGWTLQADKPFTAQWLLPGNRAVSAFAPGVTDAVQPVAGQAQVTGYLLDVGVERTLVRAEPGQQVTIPFTVTNNARSVTGAGVQDTAVLRITTPSGWNGLLSQSEVTLGPGESAELEAFVQLGTGTQGGDVRIHAESLGNPRFQAEQAVRISFVITRGVLVTADGSEVASERSTRPGEAVTYRIEVTNTGGVPDQYRIVASEPREDWAVDLEFDPGSPMEQDASGENRTPTLQPGEAFAYTARVQPGSHLTAGRLPMQVLATSVSDRSVSDGVRFVTTLDADRAYRVEVVDADRIVPPGSTTTYTLHITNEADVNEDLLVDIIPTGREGWPAPTVEWVGVGDLADADFRVSLTPRSETTLILKREVPATAPPLVVGIDRLQFTSTSPGGQSADAVLRTQVAKVSAVSAALSPDVVAAAPGGTASLTLELTASGNAPGQVEVSPMLRSGWSVVEPSGAEGPWTYALEVGESQRISFTLHIPEDAGPGQPVPVQLRLVSPGRPTQILTINAIVAEGPDLHLEPGETRVHSGRPNLVQIPVRNTGNVPLDVEATLEGLPASWTVQDAATRLGLGEEAVLTFHVVPPLGADTVEVLARASTSGIEAQAPWRLTIGQPVLQANVETARHEGATTVYKVLVRNDGGESAFMVHVDLVHDAEVMDRVTLLQVRPGAQHVVNVVGPATGTVRVSADHDPDGFHLAAPLHIDGGEPGRAVPTPAVLPALLAFLASAAIVRRRWRP